MRYAIIALVGAAYAEYPGCILDPEADAPEPQAPASSCAQNAGRFRVAEGAGRILGCVARAVRRHGLARRLLGLVEGEARNRQAGFLALWTDTRFEAGHAFDRAHGFRQTGLRELDDPS